MKRETMWIRILLPVIFLAVILFFLMAFQNLENGQEEEARLLLEKAVRRASVACYAAEGIYPPNVDYLENHYGLQIDRERFIVHYEVFASNIMPDITVISRQEAL